METATSSQAQPQQGWLPIAVAFGLSLVLSLIALYFNPVLGRDSALYIDLAGVYASSGLGALFTRFNWPWVSVVIGTLHQVTGLSLTASGHLLMALLMAGLCAVLVRLTSTLRPEAAWWGCLVALTLPAFNVYRDGVLREPGFWLFCALALHFSVKWRLQKRLSFVCLAALSILAAMVFRLEAAFLMGALVITVIWSYRHQLMNQKKTLLGAVATVALAAGGISVLAAWLSQHNQRVTYFLRLLDPSILFSNFARTSERFAQAALESYSQDHAGLILFSGFLTVIIITALLLCGPFLLALVRGVPLATRRALRPAAPFLIAALALYLCGLMIFFMQNNFLIDRYVAMGHVLAAPAIALLAQDFASKYRRTGRVVIALAVLMGLANVISLSEKRTHYREAGEWIETNLPADARVYYDDQRISFYAGRGYVPQSDRPSSLLEGPLDQFDYLALDYRAQDPQVAALLEQNRAEILSRFDNDGGREVIILRLVR